jgi:hypothetical protein
MQKYRAQDAAIKCRALKGRLIARGQKRQNKSSALSRRGLELVS